MTELAPTQHDFRDYLLGNSNAIEGRVLGTGKADAATLLKVYGDAYILRLGEVLTEDYAGLARLMGEDAFPVMGRAYVAAYPSHYSSIRWAGRHMAAYLRETEPYAERPALAEMAAFEWAMGEAFDAADADPLGPDAMAGVPPEDWGGLTLSFHPSIRRLDLSTSVPEYFQAGDGDGDPPRPVEETAWVVWRVQSELSVYFRPLEADEAVALDAACAGSTFGDVCERLIGWVPPDETAFRAASLLHGWMDQGLIIAIAQSDS